MMIRKDGYTERVAALKVTGNMTVDEARRAKAARKRLEGAWKRAALKHLKTELGRDLEAEVAGWTYFEFDKISLSPTGSITIRQYAADQGRNSLKEVFRIRKSLLMG